MMWKLKWMRMWTLALALFQASGALEQHYARIYPLLMIDDNNITGNLFFRLAAPPVCICTELSTFLGCRFSINTEFLVFALLCRSFDSFVILGSSTKIYCLFCLNLGIAQFLVSLLKIAPPFFFKDLYVQCNWGLRGHLWGSSYWRQVSDCHHIAV